MSKRNSASSDETPKRGTTLNPELGAPPRYTSYAEETAPSNDGDGVAASDLANALDDLDLDNLVISESPAGGPGLLLEQVPEPEPEPKPESPPYGTYPNASPVPRPQSPTPSLQKYTTAYTPKTRRSHANSPSTAATRTWAASTPT
jgi:hypothetical protein